MNIIEREDPAWTGTISGDYIGGDDSPCLVDLKAASSWDTSRRSSRVPVVTIGRRLRPGGELPCASAFGLPAPRRGAASRNRRPRGSRDGMDLQFLWTRLSGGRLPRPPSPASASGSSGERLLQFCQEGGPPHPPAPLRPDTCPSHFMFRGTPAPAAVRRLPVQGCLLQMYHFCAMVPSGAFFAGSVQFLASRSASNDSYFGGSLQKRHEVVRSWACFANNEPPLKATMELASVRH